MALFDLEEIDCAGPKRNDKIDIGAFPAVLALPMSINQRKHIRFSLDIPATIVNKYGERQETILQQISVGGCFTNWEENIFAGDEFRLEIELPNKNRLPLACKAIYRFEDTGIGMTFTDICQFEQQLISNIISNRMEQEGLPSDVDPFAQPLRTPEGDPAVIISDPRREREQILEKIMSGKEIDSVN